MTAIDENVTVLAVEGDLDLLAAPLLNDAVREVVATGPGALVIDLRRVGFCDVQGVWALERGLKRCHQRSHMRCEVLVTPAIARLADLVDSQLAMYSGDSG